MKKNTKLIIIIVAGILVGMIPALSVFGLIWSIVPKYPQPQYSVDSYEKLDDAVGYLCVLPEENVLVMDESRYVVLLVDRFSSKPMGYQISYPRNEKTTRSIRIDCRALENLHYELEPLTPTTAYGGIELEVGAKHHVRFIINGFLYQVAEGTGDEENSLQTALSVAKNIIDNYNRG